VDPAYGVGEPGCGAAFQGEAFRAGFHAATEMAGAAVGGEHHDAALRHQGSQFGRHVDAVVARSAGVQQRDVGPVPLGGGHDVVGAFELGDDLQVPFAFQTASEDASAEDLVVDQ